MRKLENNIGWCDVTMNPGIGCRGCELGDQCYAKFDTPARVLRAGKWPGYLGQPTETFGKDRVFVPTNDGLKKLRALNKLCICNKCHTTYPFDSLLNGVQPTAKDHTCELRRIRAFCDSNSDWIDWPAEILAAALDKIRRAPNVDVILLTKWPELFDKKIFDAMLVAEKANPKDEHPYRAGTFGRWLEDWKNGDAPKNVITLTSVLGNANDQKRIDGIMSIPSACRGFSCEPLWGEVSLRWLPAFDGMATRPGAGQSTNELDGLRQLQWIIVGCDSSKLHKGWENYESNAMKIIEQCCAAGVSVYHKQMPINGRVSLNFDEWPEWAQVRQFPNTNFNK